MIDQFPKLALVYLLPAVLAAFLLAWRWYRGPDWVVFVEPLLVALPLLVGFCALEGRWPWALHSPWRAHYWIVVGMAILAVAACTFSRRSKFWRWAGPVVVLCVCWGGLIVMLEGYAPAPWFLVSAGIVFLGGTVYAYFGASSLKVAQWMTIGGAVTCVSALLAFARKGKHVEPGSGAVFGYFVCAVLLYGFYAAESATFLPLVCLFAAPWTGLPWAMGTSSRPTVWQKVGCVAGLVVLVAIAIASSILQQPSSEEDDDYDAYSRTTPDESDDRFDLGRPKPREGIGADKAAA